MGCKNQASTNLQAVNNLCLQVMWGEGGDREGTPLCWCPAGSICCRVHLEHRTIDHPTGDQILPCSGSALVPWQALSTRPHRTCQHSPLLPIWISDVLPVEGMQDAQLPPCDIILYGLQGSRTPRNRWRQASLSHGAMPTQ